MSLLEVLLAGTLFFSSSLASLLIWSRTLATIQADGRRAERLDRLEAELQAAEARLLDPALLPSAALPCDQLPQRLVEVLESQPARPGLLREVVAEAPGAALRLRLVADDLQRERLYAVSAFASCASATAAGPPQAAGPAGSAGTSPANQAPAATAAGSDGQTSASLSPDRINASL